MCDVTVSPGVRIVRRNRGSRCSYAIEGALHGVLCSGTLGEPREQVTGPVCQSVDTLELLCDIQSHHNWSGGACGRISAKARITAKASVVTQIVTSVAGVFIL